MEEAGILSTGSEVLDQLATCVAVMAASLGVAKTRQVLAKIMDGMEELEKAMDGESN